MNDLIERVKQTLTEIFGGDNKVEFVYDNSTAGNIADAKERAAYFGNYASFWIRMYLDADSPNADELAAKDAILAYRYAKLAYALENERFAGVVTGEPVLSTAQDNTPGKVITTDNGVSDEGMGQVEA